MSEALCTSHALEEEARIEETREIFEFVPAAVRADLETALEGMIGEIRGLGTKSCLRQALVESDLRLSIDGWTFRIRTRERSMQVVAATPK
jgi:hypothetical protein